MTKSRPRDATQLLRVLSATVDAPGLEFYSRIQWSLIAERLLRSFDEETVIKILCSKLMTWIVDYNPYTTLTTHVFFELFDRMVPVEKRRSML